MGEPAFIKGCRVRLSGLSISVLNGAEGCIVGPKDEDAGRHPVKLLKPAEAVSAYPSGIKVKPANLELIQPQSSARAKKARNERKSGGRNDAGAAAGGSGDPSAWAYGLSPAEQAEWLVDCYRMRVDDDCIWGGCNLHGLYDPERTGDKIVSDFLLFCKLAVLTGVVPKGGWDWNRMLAKAAELIGYAFEKEDAKEKYGGENIFSALLGGRSLRATAEIVYGSSCMTRSGGMFCRDGDEEKAARLRELVEGESMAVLLAERPEMFNDVGGAAAWQRLHSRMVAVQ